jgi:hypothetical protein
VGNRTRNDSQGQFGSSRELEKSAAAFEQLDRQALPGNRFDRRVLAAGEQIREEGTHGSRSENQKGDDLTI